MKLRSSASCGPQKLQTNGPLFFVSFFIPIADHTLFSFPSLRFISLNPDQLLTMDIQALADPRRDCARSRALIWSLLLLMSQY